MELALFFAEVDAQPWAELQHAYGSAADVPDCLRALAGDEDEASEALSELYGSILHQGSVYEATARAVPYLARLAEAGHRTEDLLVMLGGIAEGGEDRGETDEAACRAAVVGQLPLVLGWIADEKPGLRQAAAWTAAMTGESGQVLPVLRRRWAQETDPLVRAELLGAMAHLDPAGTATEATEAMGAGEPGEVRIAALLAGVDAGRPWTPHTTTRCWLSSRRTGLSQAASTRSATNRCNMWSNRCCSGTPLRTVKRRTPCSTPHCAAPSPTPVPRRCGRPRPPAGSRAALPNGWPHRCAH